MIESFLWQGATLKEYRNEVRRIIRGNPFPGHQNEERDKIRENFESWIVKPVR
jgi:hypothetical protein